jgi:monovalent cation:proton antiporter-2 (CPA2) family protein
MEVFAGFFLFLIGAVIAVPIAQRTGLGSVLGYLIAGVILGPVIHAMYSEKQAEELLHFSEFGVVMMLFLIGLELRPNDLWKMRGELFGLGAAQVVLSIAVIGAAAYAVGLTWQASLATGMILALSSTAIVLQTLQERNLERARGGRSAFAVLLFQDIAVIPMIALLPLLAGGAGFDIWNILPTAPEPKGAVWMNDLPQIAQVLVIFGAIAAIILAGRFLAYPFFRFIAQGRSREVFTAAALALVIGTALLVDYVGLSPALGAFLAGVVLSGSEYRHELESNIEPFKGLLLGVFFISVGAGVDFGLLADRPGLILGSAIGVFLAKGLILALLAKGFKLSPRDFWLFTLALPQAGEFGFVLIVTATGVSAISAMTGSVLTLIIAVTMFMTPLFFIFFERIVEPRFRLEKEDHEADEIDHHGPVIIAGVGRFGQIVNRMLRTQGIETVVLDSDPRQLDTVRKFGTEAYYGDASRKELLEAAGIAKASVLVATLGSVQKQLQMIEDVRKTWPHVHVIARAGNREEAYRMLDAGAQTVIRELLGSSVEAGKKTLKVLGFHPFRAERLASAFRKHDEETFDELREHWTQDFASDSAYLALAKARSEQLEEVMNSDRLDQATPHERGWEGPDIAGGER